MRKSPRCHDLATPCGRVTSGCPTPTYSANRVCGALANRQRLNTHRTQASQKKRCRKFLSVDLAVDLVSRLLQAQSLQAPREFFVADLPSLHLQNQHILSVTFPPAPYVGLSLAEGLSDVHRCIWPALLGFKGWILYRPVIYDRMPPNEPHTFLHKKTGLLFGTPDAH